MKIQARIESASIDAKTGDALLTLRTSDTKLIPMLPLIQDKELTVELKDGKKRSLNANAYAWVLIDKLAEKTRIPKSEIYRQTIREIGGVSETVCVVKNAADRLKEVWESNGIGFQAIEEPSKLDKCVNMTLYYGSHLYDTKQMSRMIDNLVSECQLQGIQTATPGEIANLLSLWGESR